MKNLICYSGGKDSTAMLYKLIKDQLLNPKETVVAFADTGFEFPEVYTYIQTVQKDIRSRFKGWENFKIIILKDEENTWEKWFYGRATRGKHKGKQRGMPLRAYPCWWTRESKVKSAHTKTKWIWIVK